MKCFSQFKYILVSLLLTLVMLQSCDDPEEVVTPNFSLDFPATVQAGEPVEFLVEGAPDFLKFFSGELGSEYRFRDRTEAEGTVSMSFKNAQKWGIGTNAAGTLSVQASTDYDGSGTPDAVNNATWTDLSDRFTISEEYDFAWTESGVADITDLANGMPIYFAFRFYAEDNVGNGNRQPEWRISDFGIELAADGAPAPLTVATDDSPGWSPVDVQGVVDAFNTAKWYFDTGGPYWRFRGQPSEYTNEDWLITNAINLTAVSPDEGTPLKNYSTALESFTHTFSAPGTYTMTLIGNNTTIYGSDETIKEFTITVTE